MERSEDPSPAHIWQHLKPFISDDRVRRMEEVARNRTRFIRLAIQDITDPHNISAVLRSAEAFGLSEVDVITLRDQKFKPSRASRGGHHWLNVHRHEGKLETVVKSLKDRLGFRLAAGFPSHKAEVKLDELPLDQPLCVLFGNEHSGLDPAWEQHLDFRFTIPTCGFVESLNISVSCAVTLYTLRQRALQIQSPDRFFLSEEDQVGVLAGWALQHFGEEQARKILSRYAH